jgi:hypothetical protein
MRMMRWQGLVGIGYGFYEGRELLQTITAVDPAAQLARIAEMQRRLEGATLFEDELAWLKHYISRQLVVMKLELDGSPEV